MIFFLINNASLIFCLSVRFWKGVDVGLREGSVLFKGPGVPQQCVTFKASISTMAHMQVPIIPGACFELYLHGTEVSDL